MISAPCKDCIKRYPGCHGKCGDYTEYKTEHDAFKKRIKNGNLEGDLVGYRKDKYERLKRHE